MTCAAYHSSPQGIRHIGVRVLSVLCFLFAIILVLSSLCYIATDWSLGLDRFQSLVSFWYCLGSLVLDGKQIFCRLVCRSVQCPDCIDGLVLFCLF